MLGAVRYSWPVMHGACHLQQTEIHKIIYMYFKQGIKLHLSIHSQLILEQM